MNPRRNLQTRKNRRKRNERWDSRMSRIRGTALQCALHDERNITLGSKEWKDYVHEIAVSVYAADFNRLMEWKNVLAE